MRRSVFTGFLLGMLTSVPVLFLFALGDRVFMLPFVPFIIFDFMVRVLPGFILIPGIHIMSRILLFFDVASLSSAAKLAEQSMAIILFVITGGVAGAILGVVGERRKEMDLRFAGAVIGLMGMLSTIGIHAYQGFPKSGLLPSIFWLGIVFVSWGSIVGWQICRILHQGRTEISFERKRRESRYITIAFAVAVLSITAAYLTFIEQGDRQTPDEMTQSLFDAPGLTADTPSEEALAARFEPVPGTRPEITPLDDFYRIDIVTRPPRIDEGTWRLAVTGLVARPDSLSLDDIRSFPSVSQYATMSCISNPIGGPLISTGLWTGVPLIAVLEYLGMQPDASMVYVESEDGYYEIIREEDIRDPRTLLVYELNGEPLDAEQGFPLRFFIPNRYGMKQPKWIVSLKVISEDGVGFWVDRGWDNDAVVQMTSVIDHVAVDAPDPATVAIPIGGIAYSGARRVSRVEIQIDNGDWEEVELRIPTLSILSWVQWRYYWRPVPGRHTAQVRAFDGTGAVQTPEEHGEFPRGATGYHTVDFEM